MKKEALRLYAITDRGYAVKKSLGDMVKEALEGGATMIQLREKHLQEEELLAEANEMAVLCHAYNVPLIINDNWKVALRSDADGVHLGQADLPEDLSALKQKHMIIGVTAKTVEQAQRAEALGADYLGVGALFGSPTKEDAKRISKQACQKICESVSIPAVGIGGISKENLPELKGVPLAGVALISAVFDTENITENCRELRQEIEDIFA